MSSVIDAGAELSCGASLRDCPCWQTGDSRTDCERKPVGSEVPDECMWYGFFLDELVRLDEERCP